MCASRFVVHAFFLYLIRNADMLSALMILWQQRRKEQRKEEQLSSVLCDITYTGTGTTHLSSQEGKYSAFRAKAYKKVNFECRDEYVVCTKCLLVACRRGYFYVVSTFRPMISLNGYRFQYITLLKYYYSCGKEDSYFEERKGTLFVEAHSDQQCYKSCT